MHPQPGRDDQSASPRGQHAQGHTSVAQAFLGFPSPPRSRKDLGICCSPAESLPPPRTVPRGREGDNRVWAELCGATRGLLPWAARVRRPILIWGTLGAAHSSQCAQGTHTPKAVPQRALPHVAAPNSPDPSCPWGA